MLASKVSTGCSTLAYIFLFNSMGPPLAFAVDPPSFARVHRRVACGYVSGNYVRMVYVGGVYVRIVKERTRESL